MTRRGGRQSPQLGSWILAGLIVCTALPPTVALARTDKLQQAITAFEQRGFVIRREHPRCSEPQLFGLVVRGRREVVVCPKGNQLETLLHEGWHAVQTLCLRGTPLLGSDALLHQLGRRDRRELQTLDRACTAVVPAPPKAN